ncbi:MAG: amidohydrolase [Armatimonadetes bacterium]|nr:amidohydrolase [Armatimonadota bacterium]
MQIIDAHLHHATAGMLRRARERLPQMREQARRAIASRGTPWEERLRTLEAVSLQEQARRWEQAFDAHGVAAGFFIAVGETNEELAEFCALNPRRFYGWGSLWHPQAPDAGDRLARFPALGLRGLKLYPPIQRFHANDRALYPVYEKAAEMGVPILFHFGITIAPYYDLTYANPLSLAAAAREFPDVTFMVAHFGAGFLRETLFLAYHTENICVDTSGTNNWRLFHPGEPPLIEVFRDALRAYGAGRILFGTDSSFFGGFRDQITREQVDILRRLDLSHEDRAKILTGNARRLFKLDA